MFKRNGRRFIGVLSAAMIIGALAAPAIASTEDEEASTSTQSTSETTDSGQSETELSDDGKGKDHDDTSPSTDEDDDKAPKDSDESDESPSGDDDSSDHQPNAPPKSDDDGDDEDQDDSSDDGKGKSDDKKDEPKDDPSTPPSDGCVHLTGSVKTTTADGTVVNGNTKYEAKEDVYVYGSQLPDDIDVLYVRVTDPSGAVVLSATKEVTVSGGSFGPFQLFPFDDTPNNGGEYKVWVSSSQNFENDCTKTDNFKVKISQPEPEDPEGTGKVCTTCETITLKAPKGVVPEGAETYYTIDGVKAVLGDNKVEPGKHIVALWVVGDEEDTKVWEKKVKVKPCPVKLEASVKVEKFSTDEGPVDGDADTQDEAIELDPSAPKEVTAKVTNDGTDALEILDLFDTTLDGVDLGALTCDEHGILQPGEFFTCTGTLPALGWGATHGDVIKVEAKGVKSKDKVDDKDPWYGYTPEVTYVTPQWGLTKVEDCETEGQPTRDGVNNVEDPYFDYRDLDRDYMLAIGFNPVTGTGINVVPVLKDGLDGIAVKPEDLKPRLFTFDKETMCPSDPVINPSGELTVDCTGKGIASLDNSGSTIAVGFELVVDGVPTAYLVPADVILPVPFKASQGSVVKLRDGDGGNLDKVRVPRSCGKDKTPTPDEEEKTPPSDRGPHGDHVSATISPIAMAGGLALLVLAAWMLFGEQLKKTLAFVLGSHGRHRRVD